MTITLTREEAQQVLDALQCATPPTFSAKIVEDWQNAVEFLRARLAQPEPEPVAWVYDKFNWESWGDGSWQITVTQNKEQDDQQPLYTAPPQREWQGLTDEEIMSLLPGAVRLPPGWSETVRAIEAKLKEKNT
jgi:hypothetical protein